MQATEGISICNTLSEEYSSHVVFVKRLVSKLTVNTDLTPLASWLLYTVSSTDLHQNALPQFH